jgi:hypothetical protein
LRIDTRPVQWIGAELILGWAGFVALGLPLIADAFPNEAATEAGKPVTVGGVTITPSECWSLPKDESAILLHVELRVKTAPDHPPLEGFAR